MEDGLDHVGRVVQQWQSERPDLDVAPQGIFGRLHRLAARLTQELVAVYSQFGLDEGEFDVLATLRRSGAPFELTPGELAATSMVSSGAITKRVDRCLSRGLATKRVSERDGRSRVVALTANGRELIDRAFEAHIANEHRLLEPLGVKERARLTSLLHMWGEALDSEVATTEADAAGR